VPILMDDDAPLDSAAHVRVRFDNTKQYHCFVIPGEKRAIFTVSDKRYNVSFDDRRRIARICYAHFERGLSKDDVARVREELLLRCTEADAAKKETSAGTKLKGSGSVDPGSDQNEQPKVKEAKAEVEAKAEAPAEAKAGDQGDSKQQQQPVLEGMKQEQAASASTQHTVIEEDAPKHSLAHDRVRYKKSGGCCYFNFFHPDGSREYFQTAVLAAGSLENAMRISRLCYFKFEQGMPRSEVEAFRGELYARCGWFPVPAGEGKKSKKREKREKRGGDSDDEDGRKKKKRKKPKHSDDTSALLEQLRQEGRLAGAIRVQGRDASAKNASINGVYAVVAGGFRGARAYEKLGSNSARFLVFSARKKRWMISDELDDAKKGFAFAKAPDGGKAPPPELGEQLRWHVFGGKEEGYSEDPAVHCVAAAEDSKADAAVNGREAKRRRAAEPADKAKVESGDSNDGEDSDASRSSSSSSSSGSDAEDDAASDSDDAHAAVAVAAPAAKAPESGPLQPAAVTNGPLPQGPGVRRVKGKVCAKMLVSAGLRCQCHFAYRRDCPALAR